MPEEAGTISTDNMDATPAETASYIADLTGELSGMARQADLTLLAYLLDVAALEAKGEAKARQ